MLLSKYERKLVAKTISDAVLTKGIFRMKKYKVLALSLLTLSTVMLFPALGFCSVESSLSAIQSKLIGTILPLVSVLGLVWAGLSFAIGHPNARSHLMLAIFGALVGFGAPSIIALVRSVVH